MRKAFVIALFLILLCFQVALPADDLESLVISNDKTKEQGSVTAAMAPNGNILVCWTQKISNSADDGYQIVYTLCKLGANGHYTVGALHTIATGGYSYYSTNLSYNAARGTWGLVFARMQYPICYLDISSDIYCAEINANGGLKIGPKEIFAKGSQRNSATRIHWLSRGPHKNGYLLVWTVTRPQSGNTVGICSMLLDADLNPKSDVSHIYTRQYNPDFNGKYYPGLISDVVQNINGEFLLCFSDTMGPEYNTHCGYIARLDQQGRLVSRSKIAPGTTSYPVRLIRLKQQIFIATFWMAETGNIGYFNRLFLGTMKPKSAPYELMPEKPSGRSVTVKLEDDTGAYTVSIPGGQFWGQYINSKGKAKVDPVYITKGAGKATGVFDAFCIPGTNRIFVLWQHKYSVHKTEVRALVFDAL